MSGHAKVFTPAVVREVLRQTAATGCCPLCGASDAQRGHDRPDRLPRQMRAPEDVLAYAKAHGLPGEKREHFCLLLLNARHGVIGWETVSIGSLNASIVHPREVFRAALLAAAASIVLVHNHPSGDPEPSEEDLSITRRLVEVGERVGIAVLDHVVVGAQSHISFRERKLI